VQEDLLPSLSLPAHSLAEAFMKNLGVVLAKFEEHAVAAAGI